MKKLPESKAPKDIEAWKEALDGVRPIARPEEKPQEPLIIKEVEPSIRMEGVYNPTSWTELEVGNTDNLDRNTAERFRKGAYPVEATLDLHGRTEKEAFSAMEDFIKNSYLQGHRRVLIITGKGIKSEDEPWYEAKGVLREALPAWLNSPNIRPFILSICPAGRDEGGSGAMSILLKRQRDPKSIRKRTR